MDNSDAINKRYSDLSQKTCCLSCGGAINYAEVRSGEVCVDLGSGRGQDVIRMADLAGSSGFVYGIDISEGMLMKARSNAEKFGIINVAFKKSKIEQIPLHESVADVLISNCTINHAEDKSAVWDEVYRILKPGGRFVVSDIYSLETVPEEYRNDPEAVAECWAGAVTREEYLTTLHRSSFSQISILEESEPYSKGKITVASFTVKGYKPDTSTRKELE